MAKEFIGQTHSSEFEKDEKIVETKEGKRPEYELFEKEARELKNKKDEAWALFNLTLEGGKELIRIYGAEKFTNAISRIKKEQEKRAELHNSELNEEPDMYEIIKVLEPDRGKRTKLYEEMRKINTDLSENPDNKNVVFGDSGNNIELRKAAIGRFESLDSLSNLTSENIRKWLIPETGNMRKYIGMTGFNDIDEAGLSEQLEKYNNDVIGLTMDKYRVNNEKSQELNIKKQELIDSLRKEIEQIVMEARIKYLKENNEMLRSLDTTRGSEPIADSEAGKKIIDTAVASMEKILKEHYENVEKEIIEKTKEQRELINKIENTRFSS